MLRFVILVFGIMLILASGAVTSSRAESPPDDCIVFAEEGLKLICNESRPVKLMEEVRSQNGGSDFTISPDGKWLAVVNVELPKEDYFLARLRTNGRDYEQIVGPPLYLIEFPAWSPDGQWIAFIIQPGGLHVVHPDGSELHSVTEHPAFIWGGLTALSANIAWSPDSQWIAVTSSYDPISGTYDSWGNTNIWRVHIERSIVEQLTTENSNSWPVWSPDGEWIAYVSGDDERTEIFKMRSDGSESQRLTFTPDKEGIFPIFNRFPAWSPDGQEIWYKSMVHNAHVPASVYRMSADGDQPQLMVDRSSRDKPVLWSSDGEWILTAANYLDKLPDDLVIMRPDGSDRKRLTFDTGWIRDYDWVSVPSKAGNASLLLILGAILIVGTLIHSRKTDHDSPTQ
jgi:Tol biopolymer transport system component